MFLQENDNKPKGIRIRVLSISMLVVALVLFAFTVNGIFNLFNRYEILLKSTDDYILVEKDIEKLNKASQFLTEQVKLFVATQEYQYLKGYFDEVNTKKNRDNAIEEISKIKGVQDSTVYQFMTTAMNSSNELMTTEIHAMKLVVAAKDAFIEVPEIVKNYSLTEEEEALSTSEKLQKANRLVFGIDYANRRNEIDTKLSDATFLLMEFVQKRRENDTLYMNRALSRQILYIILLLFLICVLFVLIERLVLSPIRSYIKSIKSEQLLKEKGPFEFLYLVHAFNDIFIQNDDQKRKLKYQAEHDILTGLFNRTAYESKSNELKKSLCRIGLMLVDVDKFKHINDTYGHKTGDWALQNVAEKLTRYFAEDFPVFRYGGDEFAVMITDVKPEIDAILVEKINLMNNELANPDDKSKPSYSMSVGIAFSQKGYEDDLFKKADRALYKTKSNGRNGYSFYQELL